MVVGKRSGGWIYGLERREKKTRGRGRCGKK
jgi:hypothetical protein